MGAVGGKPLAFKRALSYNPVQNGLVFYFDLIGDDCYDGTKGSFESSRACLDWFELSRTDWDLNVFTR